MVKQRLYMAGDMTTWRYTYTAGGYYTFHVAATFHLPKIMKNNYPQLNVEYSDELKDNITKQADRNALITAIATAEDWPDVPNPFLKYGKINPKTGLVYDLTPVQRVAVKFAEVTDDKCIVAYDMG